MNVISDFLMRYTIWNIFIYILMGIDGIQEVAEAMGVSETTGVPETVGVAEVRNWKLEHQFQ